MHVGNNQYLDARALVPTPGYDARPLSAITTVIIHHSVTAYTGIDSECLQLIHEYHKSQDWPGFAYHSAVMPNGRVYITGDMNTIRYHSGGRRLPNGYGENNYIGYAIVLIGTYTTESPPDAQVAAARQLAWDVQVELGRPLVMAGHRDVWQTACPGEWWNAWGKAYFNEEEPMLTDAEKAALRDHFGLVEGVLRKANEAQRVFPLAPGLTLGEQGLERLAAMRRVLARLGL